MIYRIIIQPNAEAELDAAYTYPHAQAPQAAARWFVEIVEAINSLEQFSARCPHAPESIARRGGHLDW
jgi:plasmid stabilization system protein ParE